MPDVLVIEDDPATRLLFQVVLRHEGVVCVTAHDGTSALELLRRNHFDAVVLDLLMPGLTGFDVLRQIQSEWPHIVPRVVVCTAMPTQRLHGRDELRRIASVLHKPLELSALVNAVRHAAATA